MAAKAGIFFSTTGAAKASGALGRVGTSASRTHKQFGAMGGGITGALHRIGSSYARMTMTMRGLKEVPGAFRERTWNRVSGFLGKTLSGLSVKFAVIRRRFWFAEQAVRPLFKGLQKLSHGYTKVGRAAERTSKVVRKTGKAAKEAAKAEEPPVVKRGILTTLFGARGGRIGTSLSRLRGPVLALTKIMSALIVVIGALGAAIIGVSAVISIKMVKSFLAIREGFRSYEIGLRGVIQNTRAVAKIMDFAAKYAAKYPAMYEDVVSTIQSLAMLPPLKPLFRRAEASEMKKIMDIIQGLATLDPVQGVRGAQIALREALSGEMRSLRMRFEVSAHAIAAAANYTAEEIAKSPPKLLEALHAFIKLNVPIMAMEANAMRLGVQWENLFDKYKQLVNEIARSTGFYWSLVKGLRSLNEWLDKVFKSEEVRKFAETMGNTIRGMIEAFQRLSGAIDWASYLKKGDLGGALGELWSLLSSFLKMLHERFRSRVTKIMIGIWKVIGSIFALIMRALKDFFVAGMKMMGDAAAQAFVRSFKSGLRGIVGGILGIFNAISGGVLSSILGTKGLLEEAVGAGDPKAEVQKLLNGLDLAEDKANLLTMAMEEFVAAMGYAEPEALRVLQNVRELTAQLVMAKTKQDALTAVFGEGNKEVEKQAALVAVVAQQLRELKAGQRWEAGPGGKLLNNLEKIRTDAMELIAELVRKMRESPATPAMKKSLQALEERKAIVETLITKFKELRDIEITGMTAAEKRLKDLKQAFKMAMEGLPEAKAKTDPAEKLKLALKAIREHLEGIEGKMMGVAELKTKFSDAALAAIKVEKAVAKAKKTITETPAKVKKIEEALSKIAVTGFTNISGKVMNVWDTLKDWWQGAGGKAMTGFKILGISELGKTLKQLATRGPEFVIPPDAFKLGGKGLKWTDLLRGRRELPTERGISPVSLYMEKILREAIAGKEMMGISLGEKAIADLQRRLLDINVAQFGQAKGTLAKEAMAQDLMNSLVNTMTAEAKSVEAQREIQTQQLVKLTSIDVSAKLAAKDQTLLDTLAAFKERFKTTEKHRHPFVEYFKTPVEAGVT